ncbi:hypothetical protein BCR44DRAFT_1437253 [Catenaria anguillulae PL171]|uniref:FF domain-containing protein n=1 Tax=Catenaria anguillulae PL171 TaxID=765915 RepID=A0A1Y2HH26_9FUNG|nr:hypothetical protein BCR44DRAFT_1437253 [Catenaria anguillulae PL171]
MDDLEAELMMLEAQAEPTGASHAVPDAGENDVDLDDDRFDDDDEDEEEIHEFTLAEKSALFLSHLRSLDLSPFAPFDPTILPDIDLTPRQRQDLFDQYCHERAAELKAAKLAAMDPRQQFLQLVHENRKLFWEEMKRKFKKDPRFSGYGSTDREREKLWKEAKKMKPDELKRAIESAGASSATGAATGESAKQAQERKRAAAEEAFRAREAQVRADLASARQHATKVLRKANADEARALFGSLLVDYARAGDDPAGLLAAVRRDARFQQVVQLGLGMAGMQDMVGARLSELTAAAERMVCERLAKEVTMARVGLESVASVLEKSSWTQDAAVIKSVGGIEKLEAIVGRYLAQKRAEARGMAVDALADARASIEAWVVDRLAEGVDPEAEVHGLAYMLRSDPRWAGVDGMQEVAEELMRGAVKSAIVSLKSQ